MSYDQAYFQNQINKSDDKVAWQYGRMLSFARPPAGAPLHVLDAGCGAGPGLRYLASRGHQPVGIDLVEYPLRVAQQLTPRARLAQSNLDEGFIGDKSQSDLEIALPYERGKVIVTDYTFDQVVTAKDSTTWIRWRFLDTSEDTSARCVSLFMKSKDADSWK